MYSSISCIEVITSSYNNFNNNVTIKTILNLTYSYPIFSLKSMKVCIKIRQPSNKQPLWGREGSCRLRLQITRHSAHEGGKVVTLTHRPPLPPGISRYSFLEAESTPGHTEMSAATVWNRSRVLPTCSAVP